MIENVLLEVNEAGVVAEFYHQCRLAGWSCYLEVQVFSPVHRSRKFRVDCLVAVDGEVVCAVEFKAHGARPKPGRQAKAYAALGLPWRYCIGLGEVARSVDWVRSLIRQREAA